MAYQIDFTASNYASRARRKAFLRLLLLAAIAGAAYGVYDVYTTYNQPTLNMKLAEYEAVAGPIEDMNAAWDRAEKEFNAITRYYRLVWAANPTNCLNAMSSTNAPHLGRGFQPRSWKLKTGGACTFDYRYSFGPGDKAEQAKALEATLVHAVTSSFEVVDGKVDVKGVRHENLLDVDALDISVGFSLRDVKPFPAKERALNNCVAEIAAMRKKVQDAKIVEGGDFKGVRTANGIMMAYLSIGKGKPGFPDLAKAIDIFGWFNRADQFIRKNKIPGNDDERRRLKEVWNAVGNARYPWQRFRALDNDELVARTKELGKVADGVKRFKTFLEQRHADCVKKLEPFIEAYVHSDVFNKPFIESDLKDRAAKAAGISRAAITFNDEPGVEPAILVKDNEKFTITWIRWTLSFGTGTGDRAAKTQTDGGADDEPVTLARVADCAKRVLELGPGYVLNSVTVAFGDAGTVSGAVLDGLLPVKRIEPAAKEEVGNVD